jgi:hypothetical protein
MNAQSDTMTMDLPLNTSKDYLLFVYDIAQRVEESRLPCPMLPLHDQPCTLAKTYDDVIYIKYLIKLAHEIMTHHGVLNPSVHAYIYHGLRMADASHDQANEVTIYTLQTYWARFFNERKLANI